MRLINFSSSCREYMHVKTTAPNGASKSCFCTFYVTFAQSQDIAYLRNRYFDAIALLFSKTECNTYHHFAGKIRSNTKYKCRDIYR